MSKIPYKIYLSEDEMPKQWHNIRAEMKTPPEPFINPATGKYCTPEDLEPVFCKELIEQEFNTTDKYIDIPEGILDFTKCFVHLPN